MSEQKNLIPLLLLPLPAAAGRCHLLLFFVVAVTLEIKTDKAEVTAPHGFKERHPGPILGKNPAWHGGGQKSGRRAPNLHSATSSCETGPLCPCLEPVSPSLKGGARGLTLLNAVSTKEVPPCRVTAGGILDPLASSACDLSPGLCVPAGRALKTSALTSPDALAWGQQMAYTLGGLHVGKGQRAEEGAGRWLSGLPVTQQGCGPGVGAAPSCTPFREG